MASAREPRARGGTAEVGLALGDDGGAEVGLHERFLSIGFTHS